MGLLEVNMQADGFAGPPVRIHAMPTGERAHVWLTPLEGGAIALLSPGELAGLGHALIGLSDAMSARAEHEGFPEVATRPAPALPPAIADLFEASPPRVAMMRPPPGQSRRRRKRGG